MWAINDESNIQFIWCDSFSMPYIQHVGVTLYHTALRQSDNLHFA